MAWTKAFPHYANKNDLLDHCLKVSGTEPVALTKGLFEVTVYDYTAEPETGLCTVITCTRRDIQAIIDIFPKPFTFVPDAKNTQWSNVAEYTEK